MSLWRMAMAAAPLALLTAAPVWGAETELFALHPAPAGVAVEALADAAPMRVIVTLPLGDEAGARSYADAVSDPHSPLYGHFLTPAEFGARFGAKRADYEAVRGWAISEGLSLGPVLSSRAEVSLGGTAGQFRSLFATHFVRFPTPRGEGYTVTSTPTLPESLRGHVDGIVGLSSPGKLAMHLRPSRAHADIGTGANNSGLAPADLSKAYAVPVQGGGRTEVVALFEQDGYNGGDVTEYASTYHVTEVPNQPVSVNGSTTAVTGNGAELEADLDLDMLLASNPSIKKILVYIDSQDSFQTALLDAMNMVAQQQLATVFSISYGQDEALQGGPAIRAENKALMQLAAQGVSVFVSSGDSGASGNTGTYVHVSDPASQPYVTSVGGTRLNLTTKGAYYSEWVWNDAFDGDGETGGGVSKIWTIPAYQQVNGQSVAVANGGSQTYRNVPDVAAVADDDNSPVSVYSANYGGFVAVGGTSASTPLWAGWATIFNARRIAEGASRLGFFNPLLYSTAESGGNFNDVIKTNNQSGAGLPFYKAGPGFDDCSGWGSIKVYGSIPFFTSVPVLAKK